MFTHLRTTVLNYFSSSYLIILLSAHLLHYIHFLFTHASLPTHLSIRLRFDPTTQYTHSHNLVLDRHYQIHYFLFEILLMMLALCLSSPLTLPFTIHYSSLLSYTHTNLHSLHYHLHLSVMIILIHFMDTKIIMLIHTLMIIIFSYLLVYHRCQISLSYLLLHTLNYLLLPHRFQLMLLVIQILYCHYSIHNSIIILDSLHSITYSVSDTSVAIITLLLSLANYYFHHLPSRPPKSDHTMHYSYFLHLPYTLMLPIT